MWIALGLALSVFVYFGYENHWLGLGTKPDAEDGIVNDGTTAVAKYITGYIVEKSLSVDNVFVIAMIFSALAVPPMYQHRVLFWGVFGALVMRGVMIAVGAALIARFHWVLYVFGVVLILTAIKMLLIKGHADPRNSWIVRMTRRLIPVTDRFHGQHFLVKAGSGAAAEPEVAGGSVEPDAAVEKMQATRPGAWMATPLLLALVLVEFSDVIFAVDSIPAIFGITADPFLVFTSNVFAMLGLRSLYFALADMIDRFRYLKYSLAAVLALVGAKMLMGNWLKDTLGHAGNFYLLGVVVLILAIGVVVSLVLPHGSRERHAHPQPKL
jgi:tellurite resistance protein TerC